MRELERRWRETGALADQVAWLAARRRQGELDPALLEQAAWLGDPAACALLERRPPAPDARRGALEAWVAASLAWDLAVWVRCLSAIAHHWLELVRFREPGWVLLPQVEAAVAAGDAWLRDPASLPDLRQASANLTHVTQAHRTEVEAGVAQLAALHAAQFVAGAVLDPLEEQEERAELEALRAEYADLGLDPDLLDQTERADPVTLRTWSLLHSVQAWSADCGRERAWFEQGASLRDREPGDPAGDARDEALILFRERMRAALVPWAKDEPPAG